MTVKLYIASLLLTMFAAKMVDGYVQSQYNRIRFRKMHFEFHPKYPPVSLHSACSIFDKNDMSNDGILAPYVKYFDGYEEEGNRKQVEFFKSLNIIDDYLYVGALFHFMRFKRNVTNLDEFSVDKIQTDSVTEDQVKECRRERNVKFTNKTIECGSVFLFANPNNSAAMHFGVDKTIMAYSASALYIKPVLFDAEDMSIINTTGFNLPDYAVPYSPYYNFTSIYIDKGNLDDLEAVYTAKSMRITGDGNDIHRWEMYFPNGTRAWTEIRGKLFDSTEKMNFKDAKFVKWFDMGTTMWIFFSKTSHPSESLDNIRRSFVGRICKNEKGDYEYKLVIISFLYVELSCSLPKSHYKYKEMQSVVRVKDEFYVMFTSQSIDQPGSAMCRYNVTSIEEAFKSKSYNTADGKLTIEKWHPLWDPKRTFYNDYYQCSDGWLRDTWSETQFAANYSWIFGEVKPNFNCFIFFLPNIYFTHMQFDESTENGTLVFYAATNTGEVYQLMYKNQYDYEMYVTAILKPYERTQPVLSLLLDWKYQKLYIGYAAGLVRFSIPRFEDFCSWYLYVDTCMLNPNCVWNVSSNARKCERNNSAVFDPTLLSYMNFTIIWPAHTIYEEDDRKWWVSVPIETVWRRALNYTDDKAEQIFLNSTYQYNFKSNFKYLCNKVSLTWYHNGSRIKDLPYSDDYLMDCDNTKMSIKVVRPKHAGSYLAEDANGIRYVHQDATVEKVDQEREWQYSFVEWCDEFEKYKKRANDKLESCQKTVE